MINSVLQIISKYSQSGYAGLGLLIPPPEATNGGDISGIKTMSIFKSPASFPLYCRGIQLE